MLRLAAEAEENLESMLGDRSGEKALAWGTKGRKPAIQPPPGVKPRHASYHVPAHANTQNTFRYVQALGNGEVLIDGGPSHNDNQLGWAVLREGASECLRVAAHIEIVWQTTVEGRADLAAQIALLQATGRPVGELLKLANPYVPDQP